MALCGMCAHFKPHGRNSRLGNCKLVPIRDRFGYIYSPVKGTTRVIDRNTVIECPSFKPREPKKTVPRRMPKCLLM